ncbi:PD-(D/E)XK nuclease family protein [Cyclobacterium jeungdonense]|uniref:PD-(D/E)XK nuclease family protein n=1 Tax=Cyclobacterium jeungdonense TaxID=708087 RepID=A0ABT8C8U2_9BACT|nr:PD-(D/E)XK nuclease family protein [Cyclobacterium jeungdonense]MDN3688233.1 PD-(D/E)XK nuclease family protein [Cyclobacterium jeungdonense]
MVTIENAKKLLEKVHEIQKREDELSTLRGEKFNIFKLLGLDANEAGLHTKFIFELLNKNGSHGLGAVFFDGFISILNKNVLSQDYSIPGYTHFQQIRKEQNIGGVDHKKIDGGVIDLHIETDSFSIAIENKIYSGLGYQQLERYHAYQSNKKNKLRYLLLLTLDGYGGYKGPLREGEEYFSITYREIILDWLEFCHEKASNTPVLRETIKQYIITIKGILGMLTNQEMNKELENLILKNYDSARQIAEAFVHSKELRTRKMYELVLNKLKKLR